MTNMDKDTLAALFTMKESDKEFINHPDKWPAWPLLPMKKSDGHGDNEFAIIAEVMSDSPWSMTLYLKANIFMMKPLKDYIKKVYTSTDEMLNDGWRVD